MRKRVKIRIMAMPLEAASPLNEARSSLRKVPEITVYFWILKLLTTAMGETTSDYLIHALRPLIVVPIAAICLALALILQFSARRYVAWVYWLTAVMVAIFGTMMADVLHSTLGIPYVVSVVFFLIALIVVFVVWYRSEKTLSIHSIDTRRREIF